MKRPIGVYVLIGWCALQALAAAALGLMLPGMRAAAAWSFAGAQVFFIVGLALPLASARHLVVAYLAVKIVAVAAAIWAIVFVAVTWGLRDSDLPLVVPVAVYQIFVGWAFLYLFHPDVQAYLRGYINLPAA